MVPRLPAAAGRRGDLLSEAGARAAGKFLAKADDLRARLAEPVADADGSERARLAAHKDAGLYAALAAAARDGGLEGSDLLIRVHALLRERNVKLPSPSPASLGSIRPGHCRSSRPNLRCSSIAQALGFARPLKGARSHPARG